MSALERPVRTLAVVLPDDGDSRIHRWHSPSQAICGSRRLNHDCRGPDGSFVVINWLVESTCPGCGKPLCLRCRAITLEHVSTWEG